ncbi:MAG: hypothetical protein NTV31_11020, partial [Bacteroidia bacterium]|nr:hypothetical protein [Bacteroidia bacterium]
MAEGLTNLAWYYISVDNYVGTGYRGTFTLCVDETINYDLKAGAITIPSISNWCSSDAEYTTIGATGDASAGSCWANGPNYNRWFKFQATASGITSIQLKTGASEGTLQYPFLALWDGLTQIGCATYSSQYSDLEIVNAGLTAGNWYYISVDNYVGTGYRGTFTLCVDDDLNYNFKDGAIELSDLNGWCSTNAEFTTVSATADQAKGLCWSNGPNYNRWFKFTASPLSSSISIQVRTTNEEGTLRRPYVALWDASLVEVGCKIYVTDNSDVELSSTTLTPGNLYYISVDNFTGVGYQGSFTLCATTNIANDNYANAAVLTDFNSWCSSDAKYTNSIATPDGLVGTCFGGVNNRNVWFKFQALNPSVTATVTTGGNYGSMSGQRIAIFDGSNTERGCSGPLVGQGPLALIVNGLTNGNWYWISVDDNTTSGTFSLCIDDNNVYTYPAGAVELTDLNNWCSPTAAYTNIGSPADTKSGSCWSAGTYNNKWFKFQATTNQINVQIKTGSGYGTMVRQQVALWNVAGVQVSCARWVTNQGTVILQSDALTAGEWYWISVDDDNTSGTFSLCINDQVDYDFLAGAVTVATNWCSSDAAYDNTFATADKSQGGCWSGAVNKNVWFKFIALTTFMRVDI